MLIYDGVSDPDAFEAVAAALESEAIPPVRGAKTRAYRRIAATLELSVGQVRRAAGKAQRMAEFPLVLHDKKGTAVPVPTVMSPNGFAGACLCAVRRFPGTLKHLGLPDWFLSDGSHEVNVAALLRHEGLA